MNPPTIPNISSYTYLFDLMYMDGPLISVSYNLDEGDGYYDLYDWMDVENACNMWLVLRIDKETLKDILEKRIGYRTAWERTPSDKQLMYFQDGKSISRYEPVDSYLPRIEKNLVNHFFDPQYCQADDFEKIDRWLKLDSKW